MVKRSPRALVSLKTRHLVGVQINKLNIYKHLNHSLAIKDCFVNETTRGPMLFRCFNHTIDDRIGFGSC